MARLGNTTYEKANALGTNDDNNEKKRAPSLPLSLSLCPSPPRSSSYETDEKVDETLDTSLSQSQSQLDHTRPRQPRQPRQPHFPTSPSLSPSSPLPTQAPPVSSPFQLAPSSSAEGGSERERGRRRGRGRGRERLAHFRYPTEKRKGEETSRAEGDTGGDEEPIRKALALIRAHYHGQQPIQSPSPEWHKLHLTPGQFTRLSSALERDEAGPSLLWHFNNVLRYDYDPRRCCLVLRLMTTPLHESYKKDLAYALENRLRCIAAGGTGGAVSDGADVGVVEEDPVHVHVHVDPRLARAASQLKEMGHSRIELVDHESGKKGTKSPDGQFWLKGRDPNTKRFYTNNHFPPFVFEIGYSQKGHDLRDLAQLYYENSGGQIKTVLTVDIEYATKKDRRAASSHAQHPRPSTRSAATTTTIHHTRRGVDTAAGPAPASRHFDATPLDRRAAICLYRGPDMILDDVLFRDAQGRPADGALRLRLDDFLPDDVIDRLRGSGSDLDSPALTFIIPFTELCDILAEAEELQSVRDATPPLPPPKTVNWKKRSIDSASTAGAGAGGIDDDNVDSNDGGDEAGDEVSIVSRKTSKSKRRRTGSSTIDDKEYVGRVGSRRHSLAETATLLPKKRQTRSQSRAGL